MKLVKALLILILYLITPFAFADTLIIEPEEGRQPLINAIRNAESTVDLAMYGFTDEAILDALVQAKASNKAVRILLQHFPYQHAEENIPAIQSFSAAKMRVVYPSPEFYFLHQKTLLIDHNVAYILTFNFTRSTFKNQRNFGIVTTSPALVKEIQDVFDADWQHKISHPSQVDLVWSPDNSRTKILQLLNEAHASIKIYAQGLSDKEVLVTLAQAARRGIDVKVMTSGSEPGKKWQYLQKAGVNIHIAQDKVIHAKVIIIDEKLAMLGSINFTQASLDRNRELSVITRESKIVQTLLRFFAEDWAQGVTSLSQVTASDEPHQSQSYSSQRHDRRYASWQKALLPLHQHRHKIYKVLSTL